MTNTVETEFDAESHIDLRDVSERIEFLRDNPLSEDERAELKALEALMSELAGEGGDHDWEGEWYPLGLIHADNFTEAMKELCEDIGSVPKDVPSYIAIDWEKTAENLRVDYSSVEFQGATYWYR